VTGAVLYTTRATVMMLKMCDGHNGTGNTKGLPVQIWTGIANPNPNTNPNHYLILNVQIFTSTYVHIILHITGKTSFRLCKFCLVHIYRRCRRHRKSAETGGKTDNFTRVPDRRVS